jgi:hypothetical protein
LPIARDGIGKRVVGEQGFKGVVINGHLSRAGVMSEVQMFGGTGFMLNRNLVVAVSKRGCSFVSARTATVTLLRGQGRGRWR